jgi:signal transduction histidine kinase
MGKLGELHRMLDELQEAIGTFQKAEENIQEKIIEYEKLSALGRLTANVAHEIRNPVTVIGGLTTRLQKLMSQDMKVREYLESISQEVKRLEAILKDVLVFSDKGLFKREMCDLNRTVDETLAAFEDSFRTAAIVLRRSSASVPEIYMDEGHVRAAINNLISNALDAMPNGGTITVTTDIEPVGSKNYVALKIADTGTGISEEDLRMIYEPFYTTKTTRKDTGLGLPITRKIVEGHGGFVKVDSAVGKGSTFILYFPYRAK